ATGSLRNRRQGVPAESAKPISEVGDFGGRAADARERQARTAGPAAAASGSGSGWAREDHANTFDPRVLTRETQSVQPPELPRYGAGSLADLVPALLGALGAAEFTEAPRLGLGEARSACLLLVDGLGDELLTKHARVAPMLAAHRVGALTTGYPSTTATSLTSIGTGRAPGEHGMIGYLFEPFPGAGGLLNALRWQFQGQDRSVLDFVVPEQFQPEATTFERAAGGGLPVTSVSSPLFRESGLTRAGLRGGRYVGAP